MQRVRAAIAALALLAIANPSLAQTGRVAGLVQDTAGKAIKGAAIRASNKDASPSDLTSTTDDKGRFAIIGLRSGVWTFTAQAPGFESLTGTAQIRQMASGEPLRFVLQRTPDPIPNALSKDIAEQVNGANALRAQGRFEQAIAAYQSIQAKNPTITSLNAVVGDTYRQQAERAQDQTTQRALWSRAVASYTAALKSDGVSERIRLDLGLAQVSAGLVDDGIRTLQELVTSTPNSSAARDAAARLAELRR